MSNDFGDIFQQMFDKDGYDEKQIINKKYKICKKKFNRTLYKMKDGSFKILDYHKNCFGKFDSFEINKAKEEYVKQYESIHGEIKD